MAEPPVSEGPDNVIVALVSPRTTESMVGAPAGPTGVTEFDAPDGRDPPAALFATTVNVYVAPFDRPDTLQLVAPAGALHVLPPGEAVTVYPVIAAPPLSVGALHETEALPSPPEAERDVGDPGTVAGVAVVETVEDSESPTPLVAITRNV